MKPAVCLCICAFLLPAAEPAKEVFDRAARDLAAGDYQAAERGFQTVLREEPRNVPALGNLGVIYSRTNRTDQAIAVYRRALQVSPDEKAILLNLGLAYLRKEDHVKALPLFARVVEIDPGHLQARQLLAVCRTYTGELAPAIRDLEALHAGAPHDENILFLLGFAYLKNHESGKAAAVFQQMLDATGPVRAQFLLGKAHYEANLLTQAEESLLEVLRLDPGFPGAHSEMGRVYVSQRRNEDAVRELELALRDNPGDGDASYLLGCLLVQEGRDAEGVPHLEHAIAAKADFWASYFYLGKAKLRLERASEAAVLLKRATDLKPGDAAVYYEYARALQACGRQAEARRAMVKVGELRNAALEAAASDGHSSVGN
jgi:tetratricopeptide (TPR) repeat protein